MHENDCLKTDATPIIINVFDYEVIICAQALSWLKLELQSTQHLGRYLSLKSTKSVLL